MPNIAVIHSSQGSSGNGLLQIGAELIPIPAICTEGSGESHTPARVATCGTLSYMSNGPVSHSTGTVTPGLGVCVNACEYVRAGEWTGASGNMCLLMNVCYCVHVRICVVCKQMNEKVFTCVLRTKHFFSLAVSGKSRPGVCLFHIPVCRHTCVYTHTQLPGISFKKHSCLIHPYPMLVINPILKPFLSLNSAFQILMCTRTMLGNLAKMQILT